MSFYGYPSMEELNMIRQQMMQPHQTPIQNIINSTQRVDFEARIVPEGQNISDIIVQNRTVFIDEKKKKVSIKELDGTISKEYDIIIPLTPEQKQIEELSKSNYYLSEKLKEMEAKLNGNAISTINEYSETNVKDEQCTNCGESTKSTTKRVSK